jgi:tetratricopeptide (TPR) repeat protein
MQEDPMDLPNPLVDEIAEGRCVLVLGSGASMEARDRGGSPGPSSTKLAEILALKFLDSTYARLPLSQVGEFAVSQTDLFTVQRHIASVVSPLEPAASHLSLPFFRWSGIATTNYDLLVEKAYDKAGTERVQTLGTIIADGDRIDDVMRDPLAVPYLKLHGCITRTDDPRCPLILSPDQYVNYRKGRTRVFKHFVDWGFERTLIFVGQSLQDPDLRAILLELSETCTSRHRYYMVTPYVDKVMEHFWEEKHISVLQGSFSDFMVEVAARVPQHAITISGFLAMDLPISRHAKKAGHSWSTGVRQFLTSDVEYVGTASIETDRPPKDFYRGLSRGWGPIELDLDVRRRITDEIESDCVLIDEAEESPAIRFAVIKGHAGSGKTVLLRRIAWEAAKSYSLMCLYLREAGRLDIEAIREICSICQQRAFIFIEDVLSRAAEIDALADRLDGEGVRVSIIGTASINLWNTGASRIADLVTNEYTVPYLSEPEIDLLLGKLEQHHALGTLESRTPEQRREALKLQYGRQLLVALHEATLGERFEKIVLDEYNSIAPLSARQLYLTVCCLNRFNAPVRAGVISRLHGIPFSAFKEKFLGPLEQVVIHSYEREDDDYVYRARHPIIADMVFRQAAPTAKQRYELYVQCLTALNVDYSSDRQVFGKLIHARTLIESFPTYEDVVSIYSFAKKVAPDDAFPYHQEAVFEMNRPNPSLARAAECLIRATELDPKNLAIMHSLAELHLKRAEASRTALEKEKELDAANAVASELISHGARQSHGYHTRCKVVLERIKTYASNDKYDDMIIARTVGEMERLLADALQRFPDDSYLLDADAELASILSDSDRATASLRKAFEANPRAVFAAVRLHRIYSTTGKRKEARDILQTALDANPGEQKLHYLYAKSLMDEDSADYCEVGHHLQRSFSPGDNNHVAHILYGRALFMAGKRAEASQFFQQNRTIRVSGDLAVSPRFPIPNQTFRGQVSTVNGSYGFISLSGSFTQIHFHLNAVLNDQMSLIQRGVRVKFGIAFTTRGIVAIGVEIAK